MRSTDGTYVTLVKAAVQVAFASSTIAIWLIRTHVIPRMTDRWSVARPLLRSRLAEAKAGPSRPAKMIMLAYIVAAATFGGHTSRSQIGKHVEVAVLGYCRLVENEPLMRPLRRARRAGQGSFDDAVIARCSVEPHRILCVAFLTSSVFFGFVACIYAAAVVLALSFPADGLDTALLAASMAGNAIAAILTYYASEMFRLGRAGRGRAVIAVMGFTLVGTAIINNGWPALTEPWTNLLRADLVFSGAVSVTWAIVACTPWTTACRWAAKASGTGLTCLAVLTALDAIFGFGAGSSGMIFNFAGATGWLVLGQGALLVDRLGYAEGVGARDVSPV